jgi:hypothetical protein
VIPEKAGRCLRRRIGLLLVLTPFLVAGCTTTGQKAATSTSEPSPTAPSHKALPPPVVLSAAKGETRLPKNLVIKERFTRPLSVDGGKLVVTPLPPNMSPAVPLSQARRVLAAAESGEGDGWRPGRLLGLGLVSINPALTRGLPRYERRPAWVALALQSGAAYAAMSASPRPFFELIVFDAEHGDDVLVYHGAGLGICVSLSGCRSVVSRPRVFPASEIFSVPWRAVTERPDPYSAGRVDWVISYTVPRCASVFDSPGIYWTGEIENSHVVLYIDVEEPMVPELSCSPARVVTSEFGPEATPLSKVGHAPLEFGVSGS